MRTILKERYLAGRESLVEAFVGIRAGDELCIIHATEDDLPLCAETPDFTLQFADQAILDATLGDVQAAIQAFLLGKFAVPATLCGASRPSGCSARVNKLLDQPA